MAMSKTAKEKRAYILYDTRALGGNTDDAAILDVFESRKEAKLFQGGFSEAVCYSYRWQDECTLVDERYEWTHYGD
jgi:hypothetical protein